MMMMLKYCIYLKSCFFIFAISLSDSKKDKRIQYFTHSNFKELGRSFDVVQDQRGVLYVANESGVYEFDGVNWKLIFLKDSVGASSVLLSKKGRVYIGGKDEIGYLAVKKNGKISYTSLHEKLKTLNGKPFGRVKSIYEGNGSIYFLTDKAILNLQNDSLQIIRTNDYYFGAAFYKNKLYVIDGKKGFCYLDFNKLIPVSGGKFIRSIVMLPLKNNLLISTIDGKFLFFNEKEFIELSLASPGSHDIKNVKNARHLKNGKILLTTSDRGIFHIRIKNKELSSYSPYRSLNWNCIYAAIENHQGNLWLAAPEGLVFIETNTMLRESNKPFHTLIRKVVDRKSGKLLFAGAFAKNEAIQKAFQPDTANYSYPYSMNSLQFYYGSNNFEANRALKYQVFLEGLDEKWLNWSELNYREYTNLDFGPYNFKVRAMDSSGEISESASFRFYILAPWYESWWFYSAQVILLTSLVIVSAFLNRKGRALKASGHMVNMVVIILFEYVNFWIGPITGFFSQGVAMFKIITNVIMVYVFTPAQNLVKLILSKLVFQQKARIKD